MSSSNSSIEKGPTKSYKYECLDCENYKRKVIEAEQTVSGRDVLIEMLQGEIKKLEERYKTSIDDYELLRFKYCTVVQELSNLKEIQAKIEKSNLKLLKERDVAKKQLESLQNEVLETCKNQCKEVTIELIPTEGVEMTPSNKDSLHHNILKEVMNIEVIMQNQNETVKDVLMKVLNEMKCGNVSDQIEESLQKATAYNTHSTKKIQDQTKEDLLAVMEELADQVETLKAENESIKTQLKEKKSNLAQCLDVLEDNHSNLNNISGNIEIMINEKKTYLKEIEQLNNIITQNSTALKQKNEEIFDLKSKLESVNQKSEVNLIKENTALRKALNETERELEQLQENYLQRAYECTNEKCKSLGKVMVEGINGKGRIKTEIRGNEEEDKVQYEVEIAVLSEKVKTLEENLEQAKLEINEYEEENKSYSQKVNSLVMHLENLEKENETKSNNNLNKDQEKELKDEIIQMEENLKQTNLEKVKLIEEKEYLENLIVTLQSEIIYLQQADKTDQYEIEISVLKKKVKISDQNLEEAKLEINKYKEENKNYSQKVNSLEKEIKNNNILDKDQEKELKDKIVQMEENLKITNYEKVKLVEEKEYLKNQVVNLQTEIMYMREKDEILQEKVNQLEKVQYEDEKENNKMTQLLQEKDNFQNQMANPQNQKDEKQILILQENLKAANKEIATLFEEKETLKKQSMNLQNEVIRMQEKDEKQILILQEKINNLESTQNDKQKEIDQCCCVIRNIKATINDKHMIDENDFAQITFLEDKNQQLQKQISILKCELTAYQEKYKGCSCINPDISTEITSLEVENKKFKQQISGLQSQLAAYEYKCKDCVCAKNNVSTNAINLKEVNQKLQEQNNALKSEVIDYQNKYKGCNCISGTSDTQKSNFNLLNSELQNEIKELETELCQRECLTEKLQHDMKDMEMEICRRQCTINHLEQCLDKSNKILAECEKEMKEMHVDNENLKKQNELLNNNIKDYIFETERTSAERDALENKFTAISRKSETLELEKYQLSKNLQDKSNIEDEHHRLSKRYDNLLQTTQKKDNELNGVKNNVESLQEALESSKKEYDKIMKAYKEVKDTLSEEIKKHNGEIKEKDNELKSAKKIVESLQETLESSKKEQDKIMKAYKEVKDTLAEEIKKYNEEAKQMDRDKDIIKIDLKQETKCSACLNVKELTAIIMEKQKTIKALEEQNRDLTSEGFQLKAYISKLISDNKNLRTAIDHLLASLAEKLKIFTENEENICLKSNEMIVKEILSSLIDLEKNIIETSTCKERCNCMSVIKSTYKIDPKDPRARKLSPCKEKCGKRKPGSKCNIVSDACVECCQGREKGQDDKPEAYTYSTSNRSPEDS